MREPIRKKRPGQAGGADTSAFVRQDRIELRVNQQEKIRIAQLAKERGFETVAQYVRCVAIEPGSESPSAQRQAQYACMHQLNRMGINVNHTISMTFAIGSALAAIAGVLLCSYSPVLQPTTGAMPGIKAFDAAVFGGIGSIPGAFVGGILIGIIEAMAQAYISTSLANSIVFGVLIIVLLVKPAGLLGKYVPEKV